ncbi:HIRAN domain-containing protein [Haloflavibacter putidus]|uniref:DNA-binding protein n=1 Tax=Haloflavibacter putidus TaxID=2576776 RepID=A0A507ZJZ1_9FLAO|nr:HIRAN domain-containing protein [Haloflavibacter putidus]TQD37001.1 DNA-binding protein [Haloflavibacter putidus]
MKTTKKHREHLCNFPIAGFTYYEGAIAFKELSIGSQLSLKAEPDNQYDPRAIAVYSQEYKLGYVPRNENRIIYKLLKVGFTDFEARVQQIDAQAHPEEQLHVVVHLVGEETT